MINKCCSNGKDGCLEKLSNAYFETLQGSGSFENKKIVMSLKHLYNRYQGVVLSTSKFNNFLLWHEFVFDGNKPFHEVFSRIDSLRKQFISNCESKYLSDIYKRSCSFEGLDCDPYRMFEIDSEKIKDIMNVGDYDATQARYQFFYELFFDNYINSRVITKKVIDVFLISAMDAKVNSKRLQVSSARIPDHRVETAKKFIEKIARWDEKTKIENSPLKQFLEKRQLLQGLDGLVQAFPLVKVEERLHASFEVFSLLLAQDLKGIRPHVTIPLEDPTELDTFALQANYDVFFCYLERMKKEILFAPLLDVCSLNIPLQEKTKRLNEVLECLLADVEEGNGVKKQFLRSKLQGPAGVDSERGKQIILNALCQNEEGPLKQIVAAWGFQWDPVCSLYDNYEELFIIVYIVILSSKDESTERALREMFHRRDFVAINNKLKTSGFQVGGVFDEYKRKAIKNAVEDIGFFECDPDWIPSFEEDEDLSLYKKSLKIQSFLLKIYQDLKDRNPANIPILEEIVAKQDLRALDWLQQKTYYDTIQQQMEGLSDKYQVLKNKLKKIDEMTCSFSEKVDEIHNLFGEESLSAVLSFMEDLKRIDATISLESKISTADIDNLVGSYKNYDLVSAEHFRISYDRSLLKTPLFAAFIEEHCFSWNAKDSVFEAGEKLLNLFSQFLQTDESKQERVILFKELDWLRKIVDRAF